jgi:TPR repeat protein
MAAAQGDIHSQYNLGFLYQEENNLEQAKIYYQMSIDQGDSSDPAVVRACVNLGGIYNNEGNKEMAKTYWEEAAAQGNANAQEKLDSLMEQGSN